MNKRSLKTLELDNSVKKMKHWSLGLLEAMKDPESIVKETNLLVIIKDKYPKSKLHYLVLPRDNISNIFQLNRSHISLIEHFGLLYEEVKNENKSLQLRAGFHAVPSMQRLHMHIISKDMISLCLKTKVHWNSFNTDFFIPHEAILKDLKEKGSVNKIPKEVHKSLMNTPLKCNQCKYEPKNMPQLKQHLLSHEQ